MNLFTIFMTWALIVVGLFGMAYGLLGFISPKKPAAKPKKQVKQFGKCSSCFHGLISAIPDSRACGIHGKHVELHHSCEEWR